MTLWQFSSVQYSSSLETSAFHTPFWVYRFAWTKFKERPDLLFFSYTSFLFVGGAKPAHWDSRPLLSRFNVFAEFVEYLSCNQLRQLDLTKAYVEINLDLSSSSERCIGQEPQAWNPPTLNTHFLSSGIRIHQMHSSFLEFLTSPLVLFIHLISNMAGHTQQSQELGPLLPIPFQKVEPKQRRSPN